MAVAILCSVTLIGLGAGTTHAEILSQDAGSNAAPGLSANLVSSVVTGISSEPCTSPCTVTVPVPPSQANNFLNISLKWSYSGSAPAITNVYCNSDTGQSQWKWTDFRADVADTEDQSGGADYYIAGAAAGCTSVSATFSQPLTNWTGHYMELTGVAASNPIDAVAGQITKELPKASPGSLITSANGDVVYVTCIPVTNGIGTYSAESIADDSDATSLEANLTFASGGEAFIQASPGSVTPTMTFNGYAGTQGDSAACMALAIKASPDTGTLPTGPHILQEDLVVGEAATLAFQFSPLNSGDALVFSGLSSQSAATQWTKISDTLGTTWTTYNAATDPEWAIDCDAASGADMITLSGVSSGFGGYVIQEISGLNNSSHTSCIDTTAGFPVAGGNSAPYSNAPVITPSTSGSLIEAMIQFGIGPATSAPSPAGAVFAFPTYTGMTDASTMTEGGGFAWYANHSTSAESFSWTNVNSDSWNASALAFLPAVSPATPTVTVTPSSNSIASNQQLTVTVMVAGTPTPTGTVTLSGGGYTSAATTLTTGSATITIPAGSLAVGSDTLTVTYTPDASSSSAYTSATGTASVTVNQAVAPAFALSNSGSITVDPGATTGNTSVIAIAPSGGFSGAVNLSCDVSPAAAIPPTCTIPASVSIAGSGAVTATLTVNTVAGSGVAALVDPERSNLVRAGVLAFALVFCFGIPARRNRRFLIAVLFVSAPGVMTGCGGNSAGGGSGGSTGTTPGAYTVTVTGTSGSLTASTSVSLTVN